MITKFAMQILTKQGWRDLAISDSQDKAAEDLTSLSPPKFGSLDARVVERTIEITDKVVLG